jgi:osmotically-inducible protein OsmY
MFKKIRRPFRPLYRAVILAALWSNRRDLARWARFAKRAAAPATRPNPEDLKLEAKVRASLSADPLLRADPSIRDVRVRDGVVVLETPADWHNKSLAVTRLSQVKGVESVHTAVDVDEQNWLDVDVIDITRPHAVV